MNDTGCLRDFLDGRNTMQHQGVPDAACYDQYPDQRTPSLLAVPSNRGEPDATMPGVSHPGVATPMPA